MEVSVIVPTYNGAKKIPVLLNALQKQTFSDFQLVIVVDGSTDDTIRILDGYSKLFRKIKIIVQPRSGRAIVRNRGAHESEGELLIFFDDDMEPAPDSVERHYKFHLDNPGSVLGGDQIDLVSNEKTDLQNYKANNYKKWTKHFNDGLNVITKERPFLTAANMSVNKDLFLKLGGFDSRLTDIEDLEFIKRALRQNIAVFFDKSNKAIHHDPITCFSYIKRVRQYTQAQQYLHTLFPNDFPDRMVHSKIKRLFYSFFAFGFWVHLIDSSSFLRIFPVFMRYKLYDWIIYSLGVVFNRRDIKLSF